MEKRDIIVIGASSGGLETLCTLLAGLPPGLPASVFIVQHVGATSILPDILGRCGAIKVVAAADRHKIERGRAYVAPADHHLLLNDGHVQLSKGARENRHRPSVDALFRSAARTYRSRVVAVVLSGALDDGATGAFAVKTRGGLVVVQDPRDALVPEMPQAVLRAVKPDYCVPLARMAPLLVKLSVQKAAPTKRVSAARKPERGDLIDNYENATPAAFTCPDCGGPLYRSQLGKVPQYRCEVGHLFSPGTLTEAHKEALERALFTALRILNERATIHQSLAKKTPLRNTILRPRFKEVAEAAARDSALLREILERI